MIEITAIDKEHAMAIHARQDFKSELAGRTVMVYMDKDDSRVQEVLCESIGYISGGVKEVP